MRLKFFLIFLILCPEITFASQDSVQEQRLWNRYTAANNNDTARVNTLLQIAAFSDLSGDTSTKDKVFSIALEILKERDRHDELIDAYYFFLNLRNSESEPNYEYYTNNMLELATDCGDNACLAKAHIVRTKWYLFNDNIDKDITESNIACNKATDAKNDTLIIDSKLVAADALEKQNDNEAKINALNIYLSAKLLATKIGYVDGIRKCYQHLSHFYYDIDGFDQAIAYKNDEINLLLQSKYVDSNELERMRMELSVSLLKTREKVEGERILQDVVNYSISRNNFSLKNDALKCFRNYYLASNNVPGIAKLYQSELKNVADTALFFRIKAYIFDAENNIDSATAYYLKALSRLKQEGQTFEYVYLQLYFGRFLLRNKQVANAIIEFKNGFYALPSSYLPYIISLTHELDNAYVLMHQYDSAYTYRLIYDKAVLDRNTSINGEALLRQRLDSDAKQKKFEEEKERERKQKEHLTQYTFIVFGIAATFIILSLLSSLPVPRFVIRATGFFAFIFLFEFLVMVTDIITEEHTSGEPVFVLLWKIGIILLLSPLHHWMEEKVLHYFYEHKLIYTAANRIRPFVHKVGTIFDRKAKPQVPTHEEQIEEGQS